jgi:C4-dicarboxylate-specific signal transduction histidine kinase
MSEVATSVLHNVGNVLNSVNISCSVVSNMVRKSRITSVTKTAELLQQHEADLAGFFTLDPNGRKLPGYLGKLAARLSDEQTVILDEILLLDQNIEHIKDIISVQQNYAKNLGGVRETLALEEVVEDSLRMNRAALDRHRVEIVREYSELPPIPLEKHKVLQILVNLVRNAKHALTDSGRMDRRLVVSTSRRDDRVAVSVTDNGVGIAPENLTRIFAHGFTTKKDGHGFGLHSGVLAAQEMGGRLTVHSDGSGHGATFTLELPLAESAAS